MPLFLFISGYLFSYLQNHKNKYQNFKDFILNKTHRLFIPYIIFALAILFSINDFSWNNLIKGYSHLWFILMLYWSFIVTWIVGRIKSPLFHILILFISIWISFYAKNKLPLSINFLTHHYVWFLTGYLIVTYKQKLNFLFSKKLMLIYGLIWISTSVARNTTNFHTLHLLYTVRYLNMFSFILFVFSIFEDLFIRKKLAENTFINRINKYSYGIYIFHGWIYSLIFKGNAYFLAYISPFAKEYTIIFPIIFFAFLFSLSYIITHFFLKTKVGKYLIG